MLLDKSDKVLFINNWGYNPNRRVYHIFKFMNSKGIESMLLGRKNKAIPSGSNIFLFDIPFQGGLLFLKNPIFSFISRLYIIILSIKFIFKFRPTKVYIRDIYFTFVFQILSTLLDYKVIHESHGMHHKELFFKNKKLKGNLIYYLDKYIFSRANGVVVITEALKKNIEKFTGETKCFIIPNGIQFKIISKYNLLEKRK